MSTATEEHTHSFQAEVRQLLDIVIHSLYTDKEIFVRELVSNASDALEKMRLKSLTEKDVFKADRELAIEITTDEEAKTLTISDSGIGMNKDELVENLGTIAHSGTKAFLEKMKEQGDNNADVIGQFGVGFYSAFMAAYKVEVHTHSWENGTDGHTWSSDGATGYSIDENSDAKRGCSIVVYLKDDMEEFSQEARIKGILEKYSNFVSFPIKLNGEHINTVEALWLKSKSEITEEQYNEFYKFTAHAFDDPRYTMHFSADAPLTINALLFTPTENTEQFGMGQMEAGVSLYCRKVLIDAKPEKLLPEWLRFLRGVIDSEDLPLNISRESMQDSALVQKLNGLITKRYLKFLEKEAKNNSEDYLDFYKKFSRFLKEGIATSYEHQAQLAGLLRFESSLEEAGKLTSFAEYIDRAKDEQENIYYLTGMSRDAIESGPYLEAFKARGLEVCFFTEPVDQYVMEALPEFKGKKLVSADRGEIDLEDVATEGEELDEKSAEKLIEFLEKELGERVEKVEASGRLIDSPVAALTPKDAPNAQMRAMMQSMGQDMPATKATLEINPRHEVIHGLAKLVDSDEDTAKLVAQQLTDNALLAAGLLENPHQMAKRMNQLIEKLVK
ncbi:molecular chaperone HtpG [Verrucomicrobiaceae bacterium 5K15]|uniref:Chaperone protein HtpG n=1 Tax=Oceaniferula flava TaxID=2800421 RepID=A0AAE2SCN4_9BACT|nr:molecular chaperone HtpG [Oceaniferula flavus]MBK1855766.1 molecular chaperone HtpG [Oceaniferula flavus]MBM1137073.1 molecular chaperone HtpG [Oceaniferula flavus]